MLPYCKLSSIATGGNLHHTEVETIKAFRTRLWMSFCENLPLPVHHNACRLLVCQCAHVEDGNYRHNISS